MPETGSRHPRPAFVEDWDDDAQTTLSASRATANVAVKRSQSGFVPEKAKSKLQDGSDSGYSSRAPTIGSASTGAGKMAALRVDTALRERERNPYTVSSKGNANHRESFSRPAVTTSAPAAVIKEAPFVHLTGLCMTCDRYGYHFDITPSAAQPPTPTSPKTSKKSAGGARKEPDSKPSLKHYSTAPESRPQHSATPAVQSTYSAGPYAQYSSWNPAPTPVVYSYAPPVTSTYVRTDRQASYFDPVSTSESRPKATQRSTMYGEPVIKQSSREESKTPATNKRSEKDHRPYHSTSHSVDFVPIPAQRQSERPPPTSVRRDSDNWPSRPVADTYGSRLTRSNTDAAIPSTAAHRSERDRIDKMTMPPPERPKKQAEMTRRPSLKKSSTYNPEIVDHRRSRTADDYEIVDVRVPPSPKARGVSPSRPPTSYRPPVQDVPVRPQPLRKPVSYSDPATMTKAVRTTSSSGNRDPVSSMEQKEEAAEAYQASRSKMTSEELTAEKLHDLKKQKTQTQSSETGSGYSHRESHHSSSRGSSGRGRSHTSGHRTSILIDSGIKLDIPADYQHTGRPLSIDLGGGMTLSVGAKDKEKVKMIDKAPSINSHTSKRSTTSGIKDNGRERSHTESTRSSQRPSHHDDRRPPVTDRSQRSGRQHSQTRSESRTRRRQSDGYEGGYSGF